MSPRTPTNQVFIKTGDKYGMNYARMHDAIVRLAQDNARLRLESSAFSDLTDSTGGSFVPGSALASVTVPNAYVRVSGSDLSPKAGFDTALGKIANVEASLADAFNRAIATLVGKKALSFSLGTVSTTLNSLDQTLSGVDGSGTNAVDAVTGRDRLVKAAKNQNTLVYHFNRIASAVGHKMLAYPYSEGIYGGGEDTSTLAALSSTGTGVSGAAVATASLNDTLVDTFLTTLTANYARIAFAYNEIVGQTIADLTDSSGGTASETVAVLTAPATYTIVSTGGASKADLDAALVVVENNITDLTARLNVLRRRQGLSEITINTGGTPDTTLASQSVAVTGVDGTGSNCAPFAGTAAIFTAIRNNIATLVSATNEVTSQWGLVAITDNSGGTVGTSVENVAATGAGVSSTGAISKVEVDAALAVIRNANSSVAAKLAQITGAGAVSRPMGVIVVA